MTDPRTLARLIDDVAREMTSGAPAAGFRERVLERAAVDARRPRSSWRRPLWLGFAGAASAAAFIAIVGLRTPGPVAEPAASVTAAPTSIGTDASRDPAGELADTTPAWSAPPRVQPLALPTSVLEWRTRVIPELAAVAPLALGEIQPDGLSITQLDVTPLGILPITIAPIGGEGSGR